MVRHSVCLTLALAGLAASASGQQSGGLFLGTPAAVSVAPGGFQTPLDEHEIQIKDTGFNTAQIGPWTANGNGGPTFSLDQIFRLHGATAPFPDVDAMSLGQDYILADDATGRAIVPNNRWGAVTFSVVRGSAGRAGGAINAESGSSEGVGGDVFSYVLPGSDVPVTGLTQRAQDSTELNLDTDTQAKEIDALDNYIPLYRTWPFQQVMPQNPSIYFSVSAATVGRVPANWFGSNVPSGASILVTQLSAAGGWTRPRVVFTHKRLGLAFDEDIDAFAYDSSSRRILMSTTTPARDEILFFDTKADGAAAIPYTTDTGTPISEDIGLLSTDGVDAICAMDPSTRRRPGGGLAVNPTFFLMGTPIDTPGPFPVRLECSAHRAYEGGKDVLRSFMAGWPPITGRGDGFALVLLQVLGPFVDIPLIAYTRNPQNQFAGDPLTYDLVIPPTLAITGIDFNFKWLAIDDALTELVTGHLVRINL